MRTIKFRAWDGDKIRYDFSIGANGFQWHDATPGVHTDVKDLLVWEVMQFTGLTDKNGVEIYEGDLVMNNGEVWEVVFDLGSFGIKCETETVYWLGNEAKHSEVIGNKYESHKR